MQNKLFKNYLNESIEKLSDTYKVTSALQELEEKSKQVVGMDNKVLIGGTRIYGYLGTYYSSPEEIIQALKGKNIMIQQLQIIDYIGDFAGEFDVLRLTTLAGTQMIKDENYHSHKEYNEQKSIFSNEPIWDIEESSIHNITDELRKRGQHFHQDDIDLENIRLLSLLRYGLRRR